MKTLKDFMEVYRPKSPDEQKFVDKHVTVKHKDRNGNGDDVFKADNIKTIKRKEERHGYDSGDDEKVYEEVDLLDELLSEGKVGYKHYTITSHPKMSGAGEGGDIKHVFGHPKKMGKLGIEHDDSTDYGTTRRVTVTNNQTGESTHHHVYQSERSNSKGKPTLSIRTVGKPAAQQDKHANVIAHYLTGKTKLKEGFEIDLDEKTLTPAEMKKREEVVKAIKRGSPKMDKSMAYAIATKTAKRVAEEAEELDELSFKKLADYSSKSADSVSGAPVRKQDNRIKGQSLADKKIRKMDGYSSTAKVAATNEEVEELEELSKATLGSYVKKASNQVLGKGIAGGMSLARNSAEGEAEGHKLVSKAVKRMTGIQKAAGKLTKEDIINRAIDKYVPEEIKYTPEERLLKRLDSLSEGHIVTLFSLFESLNSDNQLKMIETCETDEGVRGLLDFAIENRGE